MILYRYRPIESAIKELDNETFHFATREELNDPIEGFVRVYWQGDKAAWEGLLRNYICSLSRAIDLFLVQADENILHHKSLIIDLRRYDGIPYGRIMKELGDRFLADEEIQKLTAYYGKNNITVREEELRVILHSIHNKALIFCIEKWSDVEIPDNAVKQCLLDIFFPSRDSSMSLDWIDNQLIDFEFRKELAKHLEATIEDACDTQYLRMGLENDLFLYGIRTDQNGITIPAEKISDARMNRNRMSVAVDFPQIYVAQLKDMIYPESYVVCFSSDSTNSAMWGNYAEHHRGVCLIYETDENNAIGIQLHNEMRKCIANKVTYGGMTIERNFFTTFGRLTDKQIRIWLTGTEGLSDCYKEFEDEEVWRICYWYAYISKNYQKTKEWEHEQEYRIVIDNYVCKYDDPNSRNLKYDFKSLKGVIFGINTSEYDKKRIVHSIMQKKGIFIQFAFYQAEYNDEEQKITVREKNYGYSELYNHLGE